MPKTFTLQVQDDHNQDLIHEAHIKNRLSFLYLNLHWIEQKLNAYWRPKGKTPQCKREFMYHYQPYIIPLLYKAQQSI